MVGGVISAQLDNVARVPKTDPLEGVHQAVFEGVAAIAGDTSAAAALQVIPDSLVLAEVYARAYFLDILPRNRVDGC